MSRRTLFRRDEGTPRPHQHVSVFPRQQDHRLALSVSVELVTSSYRSRELIEAGGYVAVGISIGRPKFPLGFEVTYASELAPWGLLSLADENEFANKYLRRLERLGVDRIRARLEQISQAHGGKPLALLCYEPAGRPCHRRLFAIWLESTTGQLVPELGDRTGENECIPLRAKQLYLDI